MDKIFARGIRVPCYVGVSAEERGKLQDLLIDIEIAFKTKKASASDKVTDTVSYTRLVKIVKDVAQRKKRKIIERLAGEIAQETINQFGIKEVTVKVNKPIVAAQYNAKEVGVELTRKL